MTSIYIIFDLISTIIHNELINTKIVLERDGSSLMAHVGEDFICRDTAIMLLEKEGFTKGSGPRWTLAADDEARDLACIRLVRHFGGMIAWDLGQIFHPAHDVGPITIGDLPRCWESYFVLHIRLTGHCILFSRDAAIEEVTRIYHQEYRRYLTSEFHPAE